MKLFKFIVAVLFLIVFCNSICQGVYQKKLSGSDIFKQVSPSVVFIVTVRASDIVYIF